MHWLPIIQTDLVCQLTCSMKRDQYALTVSAWHCYGVLLLQESLPHNEATGSRQQSGSWSFAVFPVSAFVMPVACLNVMLVAFAWIYKSNAAFRCRWTSSAQLLRCHAHTRVPALAAQPLWSMRSQQNDVWRTRCSGTGRTFNGSVVTLTPATQAPSVFQNSVVSSVLVSSVFL